MRILKSIRRMLGRPKRLSVQWDVVRLVDGSDMKAETINASHQVLKLMKKEDVIGYFRSLSDLKAIQTSFAVEKLAEILGLSAMVPHTECVKLRIKGEELYGTLQEPAKGECIIGIDTPERRTAVTPAFQRAINAINVMDIITHDADHSPNNYNVIFDEQRKAIGISCFDNNGVGSFPNNASIRFETYKQCSAVIDGEGSFNRPFVDRELKERLQRIKLSELFALGRYLHYLQILFTWIRIKKLVNVLSGLSPDRVLSEVDWNEQTIERELSGDYGKTYLSGYLIDCCVPITNNKLI